MTLLGLMEDLEVDGTTQLWGSESSRALAIPSHHAFNVGRSREETSHWKVPNFRLMAKCPLDPLSVVS